MYSIDLSCPQCGRPTIRKSRRRFYDWPMVAFGLKAARCISCGLRFYRNQSETERVRRAA